MKTISRAAIIAFALISTNCQRKNAAGSQADPQLARQLADLERKSNEAIARQQELERELENQKLATEREAIERERQLIEEARYELEQKENEDAAAEAAALLQREKDLATREGKVELLQTTLEEKQSKLQQQESELSERDRQLAGREAIALPEEDVVEESEPVGDYGMFHESLSSYGSWFETPDYGYVWQPVVVRDVSWRPYTRGRWACSDQGWTWISDEPFGWATYHYGRWALCRNRGWIWIPGSQWAPSWVSWRSSGNHVGWAPLPPETLAWQENRWDSSVDSTFGIGAPWFVFVETRHFGNPIHHHCLPYDRNPIFIQQTVNITHIHVHNRRIICGGPTYGDVQKQVERPLPFYRLEMDRHNRFRDPVSMRPRVDGKRLRVCAPNLATPWNRGLRPEKLRGRLDDVQVVRTQDMRPDVSKRFQQVREEEKRKADDLIRNLGGENELRRRRLEQLAQNQRAAEEKRRRDVATRPAPRPGSETRRDNVGPIVSDSRPDRPSSNKPSTKPDADVSPAISAKPPRPGAEPRDARPTRSPSPPATSPDRKARPSASDPEMVAGGPATPTRRRPQAPALVGEAARPRIAKPADELHQKPQQTTQGKRNEPPRQMPEETRRRSENPTPAGPQPLDVARREPPLQAQRQQQERARQQQLEEKRQEQQRELQRQRAQQEEVRREQMKQARQEQARREQQQQQERARQQQMEEARREQMEQTRREQARQQQQQQQERARQQQMAEARREQARQEQQREAQRQRDQQERQRQQQQQQQQQEERRGRNR